MPEKLRSHTTIYYHILDLYACPKGHRSSAFILCGPLLSEYVKEQAYA